MIRNGLRAPLDAALAPRATDPAPTERPTPLGTTPGASIVAIVLRFGCLYALLAILAIPLSGAVHATIARGVRDALALVGGEPRLAEVSWMGAHFRVVAHHPAMALSVTAPEVSIPLLVPAAASLAGVGVAWRGRALRAVAASSCGLLIVILGAALSCVSLLAEAAEAQGIRLFSASIVAFAAESRNLMWGVQDFGYPAFCSILLLGAPALRSSRTVAAGRGRAGNRVIRVAVASVLAALAADLAASARLDRYDRETLLAELEETSPRIGEYYLSQARLLAASHRRAEALMALERAARRPDTAERAHEMIALLVEEKRRDARSRRMGP